MHYFFKNLPLYFHAYIRQTKYIVMMTKERFNKIVNFMTPRTGVLVLGCGHICHIVKIHYYKIMYKILLLYFQLEIIQTMYIVLMTKEGSTKIVNFMTPGAGVLMLGRGHISHYSEYVLSSTLSIYSTLIAVVLRDYDAAILYPLLIFIYSMMGLLIYKYEPF